MKSGASEDILLQGQNWIFWEHKDSASPGEIISEYLTQMIRKSPQSKALWGKTQQWLQISSSQQC